VVAERLEPARKTIVEIGSCEGILTLQLAGICRQVIGLEVRPRNIICALARLFVHDVHNARFLLHDVRQLSPQLGPFDIVFHVGVLYHLADPISHLMRIVALAPDLVLDTHYASDALPWPRAVLPWGEQCYGGKVYREGGWRDNFSGVESAACWLDRADLLRVLSDAGYTSVEIMDDRLERNGPRLTLLARRPAEARPALSAKEIDDREQQVRRAWEDVLRGIEVVHPQAKAPAPRLPRWARTLGRLALRPFRSTTLDRPQ
jgi:tRNA (mo5U34)-methyltransferase